MKTLFATFAVVACLGSTLVVTATPAAAFEKSVRVHRGPFGHGCRTVKIHRGGSVIVRKTCH